MMQMQRRGRFRAFGLTVLLCLCAVQALASGGRERLDAFFDDVKTVRADFRQTVLDASFTTVQETSGQMVIARPDRFRWDYRAPYEQLIVGDGERLWLYDVDLEQVTVKRMDAALGNTPALLLSGDKPLDVNFTISELGARDGYEWVELRPFSEDSTFTSMMLGFDEQNLRIMELVDSFGQTTRLEFSNVVRNPVVDAQTFVFVPPEGVDVVGEGY